MKIEDLQDLCDRAACNMFAFKLLAEELADPWLMSEILVGIMKIYADKEKKTKKELF